MSKLSKLFGRGKEYTIGGEVFLINPLSIEDLDLVMGLEKDDKRTENLKKLIFKTLKQSVPDATEQEINGVSIKFFKEFTEAILEVNGLKPDVDKGKTE